MVELWVSSDWKYIGFGHHSENSSQINWDAQNWQGENLVIEKHRQENFCEEEGHFPSASRGITATIPRLNVYQVR